VDSYRFLEAAMAAKVSAEGERSGSARLSARSGKAEEGGAAKAAATVEWERRFEDLVLSLSTDVAAREGMPSLGLDLSLELFDGASAASPVVAKGGIGLGLPCGERGSLYIDADLPGSGFSLDPRLGSEERKSFEAVLRLRYKASFGSSTRRPRSRKSTFPKASSIAHRAAS
jgi:hypothetical protein